MKKPYQPRNGKYQRTNINITPERKRKAVRIGGSISGGIAKALDWVTEDADGNIIPIGEWRNAPESEKE